MRFTKDYSKFEKEIFTSIRKNTHHMRWLGSKGNSIKIQTPTQEFRAYIIAKNEIKKSQITEKLARSDADCTKAELVAMLEKWHGKQFDDFLLLTFNREGELPPKKAGWLPTSENINALPDPLREYIHNLAMNFDPAGMVQENALLRDTCKALELRLEELPEITEEWIEKKAKKSINKAWKDYETELQAILFVDPISKSSYRAINKVTDALIEQVWDIIRSLVGELALKINKKGEEK